MPFVLNGDSNSKKSWYEVAISNYTHVWLSAEILVGHLLRDDYDAGNALADFIRGGKRKKKKPV
jgi:hypothetical protein